MINISSPINGIRTGLLVGFGENLAHLPGAKSQDCVRLCLSYRACSCGYARHRSRRRTDIVRIEMPNRNKESAPIDSSAIHWAASFIDRSTSQRSNLKYCTGWKSSGTEPWHFHNTNIIRC